MAADTQSEFVWTVDKYSDSVKQRKRATVEREDREQQRIWGEHAVTGVLAPGPRFDSQLDAHHFLVNRAKEGVESAERDLARARKRLRKCQQWLAKVEAGDGR